MGPGLAFGSRNRGGVTTWDLALPYRSIPASTSLTAYKSIHSSPGPAAVVSRPASQSSLLFASALVRRPY